MVEAFGQKHTDLKVTKIDTYKSNGLAVRLGVTEAPALVYIKDGKIVNTVTSGITAETLETIVK